MLAKKFHTINICIGWVLFCLALVVYTLTVEPTASFWDCSEYIAAAYKLQVTHPPGAPLFLLVARMFSFLAGNNVARVAFWVNMSSVTASAATIMVVFWIISMLARKVIQKASIEIDLYEAISVWGAATVGALALIFCATFWSNATETETYALSILLMCLTIWSMLNWEYTAASVRSYRWILLVTYLLGLGLGLRMFALLTIPALCLIFYFKKKDTITWKGILTTLLVGGGILFFLYQIVTLSLPTLALKMEVLCVNTLKLPFKSGIISLAIIIISSLVGSIVYAIKSQRLVFNVILLGITFVLIGYATYGIVPVRAHLNPPINEGHPSDIINFINYLKREQYGSRPLLYGPHFAAQIIGATKDNPIYRNTGKRYDIIGYKHKLIYKEGSSVLLPRTWSQQNPMHVVAYRNILRLKPWQKPGFSHQLYFLLKHQIGHAYLRYFLWNFAGRMSDVQGASWITPADTLTAMSNSLPKIPGRSNYFCLPFLLGLLGMAFQYKNDKRSFGTFLVLFLMLGVALVFFLNPPPIEPRERDYIYVGSFVIFSIWIGIGTLSVIRFWCKLLRKYKMMGIYVGIGICLVVPTIMAAQGWYTHNRSHRYLSVDSAKNLLASCAPDAILFTAGDNDTFPLWYVQEVERFRTDVRVIVLSYANASWYINQLLRPVNASAPIPLSIPSTAYQQYGVNDILPYIQQINLQDPLDILQYLQLIRSEDPVLQICNSLGERTNILPCRNMTLSISKKEVEDIVPINYNHLIPEKMTFSVKGRGLDKKDLLLLDLIATNKWKRPIYFNHSSLHGLHIDLSKNVVTEGMALRLFPIQSNVESELVNSAVMYDNLLKNFHWRGLNKEKIYYDENYRLVFIRNYRMTFCVLAKALLQEGKFKKARKVLLHSLAVMPDKTITYDLANVYMISLLFAVAENTVALQISKVIGDRARDILTYKLKKGILVDREMQEQLVILQEISKVLVNTGYEELVQHYQEVLQAYAPIINRYNN